MKLLFVCAGNTCRSPMAEALFNNLVRERAIPDKFSAESAGTDAPEGERASENAAQVLKEDYGIDISAHRARQVSAEMVEKADVVLAMTKAHKEKIVSYFPQAKGKVFTLNEFAFGVSRDISDPYGADLPEYRRCAREILAAIEKIIEKIGARK
ncbi:MAG: low molecular weight protein arginine phosphatase [Candidatus Thermoplasmatota archaeon]|nr:low molecular weight protein arginine phosphatase [Candidatus Thermoplasmatota archaeon]